MEDKKMTTMFELAMNDFDQNEFELIGIFSTEERAEEAKRNYMINKLDIEDEVDLDTTNLIVEAFLVDEM